MSKRKYTHMKELEKQIISMRNLGMARQDHFICSTTRRRGPEAKMQQQEDQAENVDKFIRQAKKYLYLEKLILAVLNDLMKAVYVHAPDNSSGHREQDVEISHNFIGFLPAALLYALQSEKRHDRNHAVSREQYYTVLLDRPEEVPFQVSGVS